MKTWPSSRFCLLIILFVWNANSQYLNNYVIQTSDGPVQGTQIYFNGQVLTQYLGIPFAKSPVGDLRFKKPQPVEPWNETYVADTMPPACMQYVEYPYPWYDFQDGKSEDCLYLNMWIPETMSSKGKLPVMFWLFSGGWTLGSNRKPEYDGRALAGEGVIVVTVNYRLGAFGFLTSFTEDAPGNVGVYDMIEGLKWVNQNVATFGGDPDRVTLFGQSAGSVSVGFLCTSPLAEGLYHRIIMESGSPAYLLAEDNMAGIRLSQRLAQAVGCANDDTTIQEQPGAVVSCLRDVDPFVLTETLTSFNPTSSISFIPQYGDEILPQNPRIALINGNFRNAEVLIGNTKDEGAYFITAGNPDVFGYFGEKDQIINKSYGEMIIRNNLEGFSDIDAVIQYYLGALAEDDYDQIREQVSRAIGDIFLLCPTVYFAERYSETGNNVHFYFFVHRPSTTPWAEWMGTVHFEDVQFSFGVPLQKPMHYTDQEILLSKKMVKIWTDFAKKGSTGKIDWPHYSREDPTYVVLDTRNRTTYGEGPHKENCDFLRQYFGFE